MLKSRPPESTTFQQRWVIWSAVAIALLAPLIVISVTLPLVVNVPFMDEWEWSRLAYHARTGSLTFDLILAPHNEHRNTLPNLIFLMLDHFGGWNVVRESAFSLALLAASDLLLWRLVRRTVCGQRAYVAFAFLSVVLCNLGQWENFALGYNIGWNLCTFGVIAVVDLLTSPARTLQMVGAAAIIAGGASFSSGQGLILWPCGLAALLMMRRQFAASLAVWSFAACTVLLAFFSNYHPEPVIVTPTAQPTSWLTFTIAYLGAPLRSGSGDFQVVLFGTLALVMFFTAFYNANRSAISDNDRAANAPWTILAIYAILGAGITSSGRHLFGIEFALESHYEAIALFLPVGTIALVATGWSRMTIRVRRSWSVALVAIMLLTLGVDLHGERYLREYSDQRKAEINALRTGDPSLKVLAYPDARKLQRMLDQMRVVHDGPFAK